MTNTTHFRPAFVAVIALCLFVLGACSSGGPRASGAGIGRSRIVRVGEIVELRMPVQADGSRQWRVSSFDSLYLSLVGTPRPEQTSSGSWEMVVRARARKAGETEVELKELAPRDGSPRSVRFRVRVVE